MPLATRGWGCPVTAKAPLCLPASLPDSSGRQGSDTEGSPQPISGALQRVPECSRVPLLGLYLSPKQTPSHLSCLPLPTADPSFLSSLHSLAASSLPSAPALCPGSHLLGPHFCFGCMPLPLPSCPQRTLDEPGGKKESTVHGVTLSQQRPKLVDECPVFFPSGGQRYGPFCSAPQRRPAGPYSVQPPWRPMW